MNMWQRAMAMSAAFCGGVCLRWAKELDTLPMLTVGVVAILCSLCGLCTLWRVSK